MFWWLIGFPLIFMIIVITVALLIGRKDRKKQKAQMEENKKNLLKSDPKQALYNYLEQKKAFCEYLFKDVNIKNSLMDGHVNIVYLSKKMVFLIDVIGNEGSISGDVNGDYWINKTIDEYAVKNPLYKDDSLIETFENALGVMVHVRHIVICPNADITNIINNDNNVIGMFNFFDFVDKLEDVFNDNDLMVYYNSLVNYLDRQYS